MCAFVSSISPRSRKNDKSSVVSRIGENGAARTNPTSLAQPSSTPPYPPTARCLHHAHGENHNSKSLSLSYKCFAAWTILSASSALFPVHCSATSSMHARKLVCKCDAVIRTATLVSSTGTIVFASAQPPCDVDTALLTLSWTRIRLPP